MKTEDPITAFENLVLGIIALILGSLYFTIKSVVVFNEADSKGDDSNTI